MNAYVTPKNEFKQLEVPMLVFTNIFFPTNNQAFIFEKDAGEITLRISHNRISN